MPFKSEKQRRYLYSQKPEVAKKFAVDSAKKGKIIKLRGGGMDMGNKSNQAQSAAMGNTSVGRRDSNLGGKTSTMSGSGNVLNNQTNQVTAKSGPFLLPTIGPLTAGFNAISKSIYNNKNLKEARKDDILGGEMLTTGQKTTGTATIGGDNDYSSSACPDGTNPPCKTPTTQIKAPAKSPFLSNFQSYDDGGEVVISSNVDKSLL